MLFSSLLYVWKVDEVTHPRCRHKKAARRHNWLSGRARRIENKETGLLNLIRQYLSPFSISPICIRLVTVETRGRDGLLKPQSTVDIQREIEVAVGLQMIKKEGGTKVS